MRLVRGRGEARWLPSRHNFALFRLLAWLRYRNAKPAPDDGILMIDRHQSRFETWAVMLWFLASTACFIASALPWSLPLALLAGVAIAIPLFQLVIFVSGLALWPLFRRITRAAMIPYRFNGAFLMGMFLAAAAYCATRATWVRFAGRQVLVFAVLNAVAAAIVFFLRGGSAFED